MSITRPDTCDTNRFELQQRIAEELISIPPLMFRVIRNKVIRISLSDKNTDMTPLHYEIIRLLEHEDSLYCAEIGRRLQIAKAQMTGIIDKLVSLGLVERNSDCSDRRIIKISLTENGQRFAKERKQNLINIIGSSMSCLSVKELEELSASIHRIRSFLSGI